MVDITWNPSSYYVRKTHFDSERMAGTVPVWENSGQLSSAANLQSADGKQVMNIASIKNAPENVTAPSLGFGEFLDIINPLQHIPVVSKFYRNYTGDQISPVAQIAGGALYGGVIGVASLVNAALQEHSGNDTAGVIQHAFSDTSMNEKREPDARVSVYEQTDNNARSYHLNS